MEQHKVSVDEWIARQQNGRRLDGYRERREAIWQWVTVAFVVCAIVAVMVIFG
ncbi:MAG: hypothetical protein ABWY13_04880 [Mesorhizobium sp.]|jgi:hypothetical protein|nr:hypothetical protein [Mesorhizobium sp.]